MIKRQVTTPGFSLQIIICGIIIYYIIPLLIIEVVMYIIYFILAMLLFTNTSLFFWALAILFLVGFIINKIKDQEDSPYGD